MKKFLAIAFAALLSVSCLTSCTKKDVNNDDKANTNQVENVVENNEENAQQPENQEAEAQKFVLGFDASFPPYGYTDPETGDYIGFDLDLAAEVCKRNNWELVLQPIDWDAKDAELDSGNINCIWNGFTINGREDLYEWTDAYVDNSQVFVVKKESGIADYAGLAGKVVAVQKDSSAEAALNEEDKADLLSSFAQVVTCAEYATAFMDLEAGAVEAIAMDVGVAKFQIAGKEDTFAILDEVLAAEQYGIGFKKGNTELRDAVQATLIEMVNDGTFAAISEKWFGYDVGVIGK